MEKHKILVPLAESIIQSSMGWSPPRLAQEEIPWLARRIASNLFHAIESIWKGTEGWDIPEKMVGEAIDGHLGPLWPGHALAVMPCQWGVTLHEPQITKALCHFLNVAPGGRGRERARSLLKILMTHLPAGAPLSAALDEAKTITVETEVSTGERKRRIDLLLSWQDKAGLPCMALIETKIDHQVTDGQLEEYDQYAIDSLGPSLTEDRYLLVLLTLSGEPDNQNPRWRPVSWRHLLSQWETRLQQSRDDDIDFARFRRHIWNLL